MVGDVASAEHRGVIPRALDDLFATLGALKEREGWEWDVKVRVRSMLVCQKGLYSLVCVCEC